ncbi:hypothetical protein LCGC14_2681280 [marine sediment metagenome]|uniref:Uncharacterized protein n=1 Tax=marine sediment metagenome TaxID=412755 RepID=A0A0F9CD00_9ZZZZ
MTDKLKTYEFRCRGIIHARCEGDAKIALNVQTVIMFAKMSKNPQEDVCIKLSNIELLGEVEED